MTNIKTYYLLLLLLFIGCSSSKDLVTTPDKAIEIVEIPVELTATDDWHLTSPDFDPYYGTGVEMAYAELLVNKTPTQEVIVAIIDSGTDIDHEDLKGNVWINEGEIADNGIDDDGNGYIDDIHGWSFIGGANGENVDEDTYELTRLYAKYSDQYAGVIPNTLLEEEKEGYEYFLVIKEAFETKKFENQQALNQFKNISQAILGAKQILGVTSMDSVTAEQMKPSPTDGPYLQQAKNLATILKENDLTEQDINDALDQFQTLNDFGLNPDFDPRYIVGDDYEDLTNRYYGSNDVKGASFDHGTHVAGIVGAVRNNDLGINGIANVKLMILRAVPKGDERDKDVANAIRYAVDNGAKVINMSFGKPYSPNKEYVDDAMKYADSVGVLLVGGSGNDGTNVDSTESFPNKYYQSGGSVEAYISVGASSWEENENVAASFSNYGKLNVDIFAPGVDVYSTYPDNEYEYNDGTSMASPVVAGVAALLLSYYPELTVSQVKQILLETATTPAEEMVYRPGSDDLIPFTSLSASGGIINAYEALKRAEQVVKGN